MNWVSKPTPNQFPSDGPDIVIIAPFRAETVRPRSTRDACTPVTASTPAPQQTVLLFVLKYTRAVPFCTLTLQPLGSSAELPCSVVTCAAPAIPTWFAASKHAFAVPSLWFKIDAVPGRLNERLLTIEKPGVYYGQCSELCGARHAYMPIVVEALPVAQWRAWVRAQGGTFADEAAPAAAATPAAAPAAAPLQDPESAVPNAAGAGAPPVTQAVAPATPTPAAR